MKIGDKVYVNWPIGKGGPYEVFAGVDSDEYMTIKIQINSATYNKIDVPKIWCEPAKPDIEDGRLVHIKLSSGYSEYAVPYDVRIEDMEPKPVNRKWDELTGEERVYFQEICSNYGILFTTIHSKPIYETAYKLATKEW